MSCITCKHSSLQGGSQLQCRRLPPQVLLMPGGGPGQLQISSVFPTVDATCRCGEFEADPMVCMARDGDGVQLPGSVA